MNRTCANCHQKLDCKAYIELYGVLTDSEFCGMIKDASERMRVRSKIYAAVGEECDSYISDDQEA